jgi:MoxR-like ATPase
MTQLYIVRISPRQVSRGRLRGTLLPPEQAGTPDKDHSVFFGKFIADSSIKLAAVEFGQPPTPRPKINDYVIGIVGSDNPGGSDNKKGLFSIGKIVEVLSDTGAGNSARVTLLIDFKSKLNEPVETRELLKSPFLKNSGLRENQMLGFDGNPQAQNFVRALQSETDLNARLPSIVRLLESTGLECTDLKTDFKSINFDAPEPGATKEGKSEIQSRLTTALAAKPFVILAGGTGTGKTRAARQVAIQIAGKENVCTVAVGSDWTDNRSLLGFRNLLTVDGTSYVAPEALKLILKASSNIEEAKRNAKGAVSVNHGEADSVEPFFLILDEMNLSHVERYFADFLSSMESGETLKLHDYEGGLKADGSDLLIPWEVEWPRNLFVIGTVNIDETTYMFSPKVLDRAHVIEFKVEWDEIKEGLSAPPASELTSWSSEKTRNFTRIALDDKKVLGLDDQAVLEDVLAGIHECMKDSRYNFAHRTARECLNYVAAAQRLDEAGLAEGHEINGLLDLAILQKVLPKLNGSTGSLTEILNKLSEFTSNHVLKESAEKLRFMAKQLKDDQFVTFIQ